WNLTAVSARPGRGNIELTERILSIQRADVFQIPAGAERASRAIEHRNRGVLVGIEFEKCRGQSVGAFGVHGVAGFRTVVNDCPDRPGLFDSNRHEDAPALTIDLNTVRNSNTVK